MSLCHPDAGHGLGAAARGLQAEPHGGVAAAPALSDEELARKFHDNAVRSLPEERAAELAARTLAFPDAQSVEDLTALLTSAGER